MRTIFLFGAIAALVLAGCVATPPGGGFASPARPSGGESPLFRGGYNPNQIFIESTPTDATVLLNDEVVGTTPLSVKLPRKETPQYIKISKDGYKTEEISFIPVVYGTEEQKKNMVINSTLFFGGAGLVAGFIVGVPLAGLLGGSILGFVAGISQEEKNITTLYEYSPRNIHIKLSPISR